MEKTNNFIFFVIMIVLMFMQVIYFQKVKRGIDTSEAKIRMIIEDQKKGKRKNPYRCTDAKKHFSQVGVYVDCEKIECEVNDDCNN